MGTIITEKMLDQNIAQINILNQFLINNFSKIFPGLIYKVENELYIKVNYNLINKVCFFLHYHTQTLYQQLIDLYGVDYFERLNRFEICYSLLSLQLNNRLTVTSSLSDRQIISTVTNIFPNAVWYEREVYDMFGIIFFANKDLRRILTDYGFKGHPMRKDFPLTGYIEIRYNDFGKRLRYERVSLAQEYRIFTFENNWLKYNINFNSSF